MNNTTNLWLVEIGDGLQFVVSAEGLDMHEVEQALLKAGMPLSCIGEYDQDDTTVDIIIAAGVAPAIIYRNVEDAARHAIYYFADQDQWLWDALDERDANVNVFDCKVCQGMDADTILRCPWWEKNDCPEVTSDNERADTLVNLCNAVTRWEPEELTTMLNLVGDLQDEHQRARALAALMPYLLPSQQTAALAVASEIHAVEARANALTGLLPYLLSELYNVALERALNAARAIPDAATRARDLNAVANYLSGDEIDEVMADAISAAGEVADPAGRAMVLSDLVRNICRANGYNVRQQDDDQWLTLTVTFSREQWDHWRWLAQRIAELATAADTGAGYCLVEADEERAECETELANDFVELLGLGEQRTPLMLDDGGAS